MLLPYCVAVWVAVIYLGEHYAADVLAGILYASVVFVGVQFALARKRGALHESREPETPQPVTDRLPA
jgi:membrane-associated phospholipid phosphatase